ncbi:APC family permease [Streptomyces sp. V3I7]|uniref:APC family permease n=1 Tax=Streptomyces sp. V3I7 TaxID=3042278 RepID=UPI0027813828|nr:APC family permease [Streptomyces sp. V3I7]MDQ0993881.1 amino acid transporter [Streptomyces sp. V3I7]
MRDERAGAPVADEQADGARHMRRVVTLGQLILLSIGGQIGSAWLFAVLSAVGIAGPAAIVSWLIAGAVFMVIALAWIELGAMLPMTGTVVRYPYLTHGAFTGWIVGWAAWLFALSIPAVEAVAVMTYLGSRFPKWDLVEQASGTTMLTWPTGIVAAIGLMVLFYVVNIVGIRTFSRATNWVTVWKIVIPVATFLLLFTVLRGDNFGAGGGFLSMGGASTVHAISATGIAFAFVGFRQVLDFGGEMKNPQRDAKIAIIVAIAVPTVLYTLLQIAFIGAIDWQDAGVRPGDWAGLNNSVWASGPFFHALDAVGTAGFAAFGTVLLIDAVLSPAGAGWIYLGNAARVSQALAIHGAAPSVFRRLSARGVPAATTFVCFAVGCLFFIPAPSWYQLVSFISAAGVLTFLVGSVSLSSLRRTAPDLPRPFRLRGAALWSPASFVASVLVIYWSGFTTLVTLLVTVFAGLPVFAVHTAVQRGWIASKTAVPLSVAFLGAWIYVNTASGWFLSSHGAPHTGWSFARYGSALTGCVLLYLAALWAAADRTMRRHVQCSLWLIALLLLLLPLSYFGEYGPGTHHALPFPADHVVVAALSLLVHRWAVASGFRTDDLDQVLSETPAPHTAPAEATPTSSTS